MPASLKLTGARGDSVIQEQLVPAEYKSPDLQILKPQGSIAQDATILIFRHLHILLFNLSLQGSPRPPEKNMLQKSKPVFHLPSQ